MKASQDEHQNNWNNRGWTANDVILSGSQEMTMYTSGAQDLAKTNVYGGRHNEELLSENVQRVVDKVVNMHQQSTPLVANNYGMPRWDPSPDYRLGTPRY